MKKLFSLILVLFFSANLSAEDILNETFSSWLPEGWSVIEGSGSSYYSHWFHRDEQFATVYVTGDNQDEWLISPQVSLPAVGELKVSMDMMGSYYRMVTMDWGDVYVYISTNDGVDWELIWKEDDQDMVEASGVNWPYGNNEWFFPSISLNDYAGQDIKIAVRYVAPDGDADWWNVDNFIVKSIVENDVNLQEFDYPEYGIIDDEFSFEGTFKNFGINEVTSFEAIYSVNGVESDAFLVDGINVDYNTTYSFTHDVPYTYTESEIYNLELQITKVNGLDDPLPDNNILYRDISIATEYLDRKPLFEVFTSSTCPTCPIANEAIDEVLANNVGSYSLVKYQVYWPGNGDPYYIVDDSIRSNYYGVGGVPDLYSNGYYDDGFNFSQWQFDAAMDAGAFAELNMTYSFNGTNVSVEVNILPNINILDAALHIAIVEKVTYENTGSNGETEFHNVLMKMLPGPYGTALSLEVGEALNVLEAADLSDTFIEEFEDLQVVVWIQDNKTRYVLQSESSDLMVDVGESSGQSFSLFPNPVDKVLNVKCDSPGQFFVHSLTGKLLQSSYVYPGLNSIHVADLASGVYISRLISNEQKVFTCKIIKR